MRSLACAMLVAVSLLALPARAQSAEPTPWAVASEVAVEARAITIEHAGARLAGTLYRPAGPAPRAAVIALHGAQVPLRTAPLYRHLLQILPRLGIAVFLYDRRGSGASTSGGAAAGNFELLAADAAAVLAHLKREPGLDPRRIGFWGLSQGGWLALLAAKKAPDAAFTIAASAPMAAADVQMNFAVANVLRIQGQPQAVIDRAIEARQAVDDAVRGRRPRSEAVAAEAAIAREPWYRDTWLRGNLDDPEWRQQISNDPLAALAGSRVPTLLIYGQADPWVPVGASLAALGRQASALPQVTVRVIDGADHAMMLGVPPARQVDATFAAAGAPDAPAYFALLGAWLQRTIGTDLP